MLHRVLKFCFRYCAESVSDVKEWIDILKSTELILNKSKECDSFLRPNYGGRNSVAYFMYYQGRRPKHTVKNLYSIYNTNNLSNLSYRRMHPYYSHKYSCYYHTYLNPTLFCKLV